MEYFLPEHADEVRIKMANLKQAKFQAHLIFVFLHTTWCPWDSKKSWCLPPYSKFPKDTNLWNLKIEVKISQILKNFQNHK